ncbi:MAG: hypothetical protein H7841_05085 [Magnetospirillum sp. WYHS-4]
MTSLLPHQKDVLGFLLRHLVAGVLGGFLFGGLLLYVDAGGMRSMIVASRDGWIYLFLLFFGLFVTFGGAGMAIGIMSLGEERD